MKWLSLSDFFSVTNLWMKEMKLNWATEEINYYWFVLNRWYNLLEYFKSKLHTVWVLEQNLVENSTASLVVTSEMESYRLKFIWASGWAEGPIVIAKVLVALGLKVKMKHCNENCVSDASPLTLAQSWPWGSQLANERKLDLFISSEPSLIIIFGF